MLSPAQQIDVAQTNQRFYDGLWSGVRLIDPRRFNTWPLIESLAEAAAMRLEVGPGMRPRLPIEGTHFVDISAPALDALAESGGLTELASVNKLPFPDQHFDLVCALDILEHVEDDLGALGELCRVTKPNGIVLLSTPLYEEFWTSFDELVGHYRRYEPAVLQQLLTSQNLRVEQSAGYGMKPKSSRLVDFGMQQLQKNPKRATWLYNRVLMPMGLLFQKPLNLKSGMVNTEGVNEVFMLCRLCQE